MKAGIVLYFPNTDAWLHESNKIAGTLLTTRSIYLNLAFQMG